jgi:hypothetical protein
MAVSDTNISGCPKTKVLMIAITGTRRIVLSIIIAPCRTPLLRGESCLNPGWTKRIGAVPPDASTALVPSSRNPHFEQNLVMSETCCWPHWGQYISKDLVFAVRFPVINASDKAESL